MNDGDSDVIVVNRDEEDDTKDCDIVENRWTQMMKRRREKKRTKKVM